MAGSTQPEELNDHPATFHVNNFHLALASYDATLTFIRLNPTTLPENINGQHTVTQKAEVEITMPIGLLKAMIPLVVKAVADYETQFGSIPAPGFDEEHKI